MAISAGLKLKLGQKLKLAPQLRQAIELLQYNRIELREHIEQALETNPLLELDGDLQDEYDQDPESDYADEADSGNDDFDEHEPDVADWDDLPEGFSEVGDTPDYDRFISDPDADSLYSHLLWQANLCGFNEEDDAIAKAIIYALDEDGYLHDDLADLRASMAPEYLVSIEEIRAVLERIQHFEPMGVAAQNLGQCLLIQVRALSSDVASKGLAEHLIKHHLEDLGQTDTAGLAKATGFDKQQIEAALLVIRKLDPRPGMRHSRHDRECLMPMSTRTRTAGE